MGEIDLGALLGDKKTVLDKIAAELRKGISFSSKNGYCLTSAINVNVAASGMAETAVNSENLNKLLKKIETGNHEKASAEAVSCPEGSAKFVYTVDKDMSKSAFGAKINVGFDLCLKSCETDDDCRKSEGYGCIEIPNGVPGEGQTTADLPKNKVCFDKRNVDYFTNMTAIVE